MDKQIDTVLFRSEIKENGFEATMKKYGGANRKQAVKEFLDSMLAKYDLLVGDVKKRADMTSYIYGIFDGTKDTVDRDKLIRIAIGFPLTLEETDALLECGGCAGLHSSKRDLIITEAILQKYNITKTNIYLEENNEEIIK